MPGALDPDDGGQQLLLGKMLLERGLITPDQLREALVERARSVSDGDRQTMPLGGILVRKGYLTDSQLLGLMAEQNGDAPPAPPPPQVVPPYEKTAIATPVPSGFAPQLPAMTVPDPLADGGALGKYKLLRELGRGGMGVVYEALDTQLNRKVALKLMLSNPNADLKERALEEERFVQEAQLSAKLKHPNIVTVYEAGLLDGRQFLSMEMIEGQAFNEWRKTVTIRQQIQTLADVASAVHHAHEQGILHRDLKPRNILVSGSGHAYVTDFGLAKSLGKNVHQSLTGSGAVVGTPAYMSPEQAQGLDRVDWRTDIYSLGVILYECMTGRTPFTGESPIEILMKVVKDPVPPPLQLVDAGSALGLDKTIENICLKALAKKDRDRYVTAQAFSDDLTKWLAGEKIHVVIPKARSSKANRRVYVLAAVLLMALVGGLVWLGFKSTGTSVKPYLDSGKRYMVEENYSEALIQYRVALANDPNNVEATMGVRAAQDAIAKKDREREEKLKAGANKKYTEWEEKQMQVEALLRAEQQAASEEKQREIADQRRKAEAEARRLKEEADKAEEEFRRSSAYIMSNTPGNTDAWKDAINLLPMIDPRRNAVLGTWDVQEKGALTVDRTPFARAEIPFVLPQEYDFQTVFERRSGADGVSFILSKVGRQFRLELGGENNTRCGLEVQLPGKAPEFVAVRTEPRVLMNDTKYVVLVQVRTEGVKAFLNGSMIVDWKTDYKDVSLNPQWKMRSPLRLGIGSNESEAIFHRIALLEVNGRGSRLEYTAPPALKAQQYAPGTLKPGLLGEYFLGTGFQQLAIRRIDPTIDFKWGEGSAWATGPVDSFSVRWTGMLHVPRTGKYIFSASADDGVRLFIDGQQVMASWSSKPETARTIEIALEEGYHKVLVEYYEMAYLASISLSWSASASQTPLPIAAKSFFHPASDPPNYIAPKSPDIAGMLPAHNQNVNAVAYDPTGKIVVVGGEDRRVRIYDTGTMKEVGQPLVHPAGVLCVAFSPDGQTLATGARDNRVRIWEIPNRTELRNLEGPTSFVQCVAWSPDGKQVACGSYDRNIRIWTLENPEEPAVLTGHLRGVESVSFSKDGKMLASAALEGVVKVWDVATAKEIQTLQHHADSVESVLYSPGGRALASAGADGMIKLWDEKGVELKTLASHGEEIMSLAFSPDGLRLAAGCNDGMIRIWSPFEGKILKLIPAHTSRVSSLAFAPSGRILASASADATVRFWNVDK